MKIIFLPNLLIKEANMATKRVFSRQNNNIYMLPI